MNSTLSKSLSDLETIADEILSKSEDTEELESKDVAEQDDTSKEDKKAKKSEDSKDPVEEDAKEAEENDEDEDLKDDKDVEEEDEEADELEKAIRSEFESDSDISSFIQNSEFCSAVVEILSKSLSDNQLETMRYAESNSQSMEIMAKSMMAVIRHNDQLRSDNRRLNTKISRLQKSMDDKLDKITDALSSVNETLEEIGSKPVMRKSVDSVSIHDRNFNSSLGTQAPSGFDALSKSQVLNILTNEVYSGNPLVTNRDVLSYESGAPLRPELRDLVANKSK